MVIHIECQQNSGWCQYGKQFFFVFSSIIYAGVNNKFVCHIYFETSVD
jgi:hypothetical protein